MTVQAKLPDLAVTTYFMLRATCLFLSQVLNKLTYLQLPRVPVFHLATSTQPSGDGIPLSTTPLGEAPLQEGVLPRPQECP